MIPLKYVSQQHGLTLLEALISLFLLTTALLGLAFLQATVVQSTQTALQHDFATLQAIDLAERLYANPQGITNSNYLNQPSFPDSPDCIAVSCATAELAKFDLHQWNSQNSALLPEGTGTVQNSGSTDQTYLITVNWNAGEEQKNYTLPIFPPQ